MTDPVRVLVVDDDPAVRELLDDYLSDQGFKVVLADGAPAGRAALRTGDIGAVLLDVGLPRRGRSEPGPEHPRVSRHRHHWVSGAGETVDRIIGLEIGADDYVAKRFDLAANTIPAEKDPAGFELQADGMQRKPPRGGSFLARIMPYLPRTPST